MSSDEVDHKTGGETMNREQMAQAAPLTMQLYATDPQGVAEGQGRIAQWCEEKMALLDEEIRLAEKAVETAKTRKWSQRPHKAALSRARKRLEFFEKIHAAIKAGYVMIPDLPVTLFAIRTRAKAPRKQSARLQWGLKQENAQILARSEGRFISPDSYAREETWVEDGEEKSHWLPTRLNEEIDIPARFVRPEIVEATDKALREKIFDEIGYAGPAQGRGDPFIVGRIKRPGGGSATPVYFFVAWHFDITSL